MADDLTVLLVGENPPDEKLLQQLEKQHVMGDFCSPKELPNMMGLADPHLVVHVGKAEAQSTFEFLKDPQNEKRIRLVVVAERKDLPELRKLDRSVVVSLLATDIAPSVIATRITMLAKKGPVKTVPPPGSPEGAAADVLPPKAKAATASRPKEKVTAAPGPKASPLASKAPGAGEKKPAIPRAGKASPPRATASKKPPAPTPAPLPNPMAASAPKIVQTSSPLDDVDEATLESAFNQATLKPGSIETDSLKPAPEPAVPKKKAKHADGPRIAVADQDITRGDLIACALRDAGLSVRLVPLDTAATRWQLIRAFAPTVLLADGKALKGGGGIWHQLFQADKELAKAKLIAVPFDRIFNEETGAINLRTLIPQLPQLSQAELDVVLPSPPTDDESVHDRPTFVHPSLSEPEEEEDRPTIAHELPSAFDDVTVAVDSSALASASPLVEEVDEIDELDEIDALDSLPPSIPAPKTDEVPLASPGAPTPMAHSAAATIPTKSAGPGRVLAGIVGVLLLAGGGWYASEAMDKAPPLPEKPKVTTPPESEPEEKPSEEEAKPAEETAPPVDPKWVVPAAAQKDCESLVPNLEQLRLGGIGQATLSWNKARKTMVLGDLDKAQRQMCEAALIHPKSLALEGLAGVYMMKHAPKEAMEWVEKALAVRPERGKTLELKGDVASQLGNEGEARTLWASALKVDGADQKTMAMIAAKYVEDAARHLKGGAVAQSEIFYRRAATFDPKNIAAATGMAQTYLALGHDAGAKAWADQALSLKADHGASQVVLADLLAKEGKNQEALVLYRKALETEPNNPRAHQQIFKLDPK